MELSEYVVLDLETTGLSKSRHRITEIAAVKYKDGEIIGEFCTLVNPERSIPGFITRLTGITNDMVRDKPTIDKVLPGFLEFLGESTIIAHNATFDYGFIEHNVKRHLNMDFCNKRLCTRKLANRLLPELPSKKLSSICSHFELVNEQAHRARADVDVTAEIFSRFIEMAKEKGVDCEEKLFRLEKR